MAYSTQNMYQMFDIIPNFIRKMFPLSLKTYPSCTNTMAWDIRDEIRSAYILKMIHQRENHNATIDYDNTFERENVFVNECGGGCESLPNYKVDLVNSSFHFSPTKSDISEQLICISSIYDVEATNNKSVQINSTSNQPKTIFHKSKSDLNDNSSTDDTLRPTSHTIQLTTSYIDSKRNFFSENSQHSISQKSRLQREYQLLAQKFHQYTIDCRMTIKTLEKKLHKLIDDKHALLHGMMSLRKGEKDVTKKYRKIFNDAMNEHCNEINVLLSNYKVIRDNYLTLLQQDKTSSDKNRSDDVLSVSYKSYNCC